MRLTLFLLAVGAELALLAAEDKEKEARSGFYQWLTEAAPAGTTRSVPTRELMRVEREEYGELLPTPDGAYAGWCLGGPKFHGAGVISLQPLPKEALSTQSPWPAMWRGGAPKAPDIVPLQICWSPDAAQLCVQVGNPRFGRGAWVPFDVKDGRLAGLPPELGSVLADFAKPQWQEDPRSGQPPPTWPGGATAVVPLPLVTNCRAVWPDGRLGTILVDDSSGTKWYGYVLDDAEYQGRVELAIGPTLVDDVVLLFLPRGGTLWLFVWTRLHFQTDDPEHAGDWIYRTFYRAQEVGSGGVQQILSCGRDRAIVQVMKDDASRWLLLDIGEWKRNLTPAPGKMP